MSSAEFAEWMAYASLEPFGDQRRDLQAALIAQTIANRHRGKDEKEYRLADFVLNFTPRKAVRTPKDMQNLFRQLTLQMGGTVVSAKGGEA